MTSGAQMRKMERVTAARPRAVRVQQSVTTRAASGSSEMRPTMRAILREDLGPALRDDATAEYLHDLWRDNDAVRLAAGKPATARLAEAPHVR